MSVENGQENNAPVGVGEAFVPEPGLFPETDVTSETTDSSAQEQTQQVDGEESSGNPAWGEFLEALPTSLHSQVTPILEKWDKGVQQRFQSIHDEYAAYKPFKEQNVDPDTIQYALGLVNALEQDPKRVWESMGEYYNLTPAQMQQVAEAQQQQSPSNDESPWDADTDTAEYVDPRISQLEQGVKQLAEVIMTQKQAEAQAAEDAKLTNELTSLKEKYGEYDENFVLGQMLNGVAAEDAVKNYTTMVERIRTEANRPPAPKVMGGGSSALPSESVNPAKMSEKQRRELATQMLRNAANQGG